jgi:ribulose-phosphate 3-epimerase
MTPVKIAPSLLAADFLRLGEQVADAEAAGVDRLHLDVMDGHFVPNLSFGMPVIQAVRRKTHLTLEAHLMVTNPHELIDAVIAAGADIVQVHVETASHLDRLLMQIKNQGRRACAVLNPATSLSSLDEVIGLVDEVLVMTVNPGFGGQKLIPYTLDKVRRLRALLDRHNPSCEIEVDGGIDLSTIRDAAQAGADVCVAGTSIFSAPDGVAAGVRALRDAAG